MPATETLKKKARTKAPETKVQEPAKKAIQFGQPIDTDLIKVEFDGLTVTYTLKTTGEVLTKTYDNPHALMIIHGRISRQPHGDYAAQCIAKARISKMKLMPIS